MPQRSNIKGDNMNSLTDLESAFNSVGQSMISEDFAYKILAYLQTWGGGNSIVVDKMYYMISLAQKKFNIYGGSIPKLDIKKFDTYKEEWGKGKKCKWLKEFTNRYGKNVSLGM